MKTCFKISTPVCVALERTTYRLYDIVQYTEAKHTRNIALGLSVNVQQTPNLVSLILWSRSQYNFDVLGGRDW